MSRLFFCERGIRTFETITRNTLIHQRTTVEEHDTFTGYRDPSHATVFPTLVNLWLWRSAAGADGLMIEVHNDPAKRLSVTDSSL